MIIYHIDWRYDNKDCRHYYVSPYSLKDTIHVYLQKWWINDKGYSARNIGGLFRFLKLASFNKKKLEDKCDDMNRKEDNNGY